MATDTRADYPRIRTRELVRRQREALRRIVRYYHSRHEGDGVTSLRFELRRLSAGLVSFRLRTRRSDCDPNSPRAILCEESAFGFIGPRGGIELAVAETGAGLGASRRWKAGHRAHVARMIGARLQGAVLRRRAA